ncbi:hypothetical protein ABZ958_08255 [Streptomyces sp. NPDC046237]|uniref:hypothetical protein n=1 Tax=Streptomyces sp. NPDC046237 TaxID=3154914 RepID=UPI003408713A
MKTCPELASLRREYEREIGYMTAHSQRHAGKPAAKVSATQAASAKQRMARALSSHVGRCPKCDTRSSRS